MSSEEDIINEPGEEITLEEVENHNKDIPFTERFTNLILGSDIFKGFTDTYKSFARLCGILILSALCGETVRYKQPDRINPFTNRVLSETERSMATFNGRPNLWIIITGRSRNSRKSTIIGFMNFIINAVYKHPRLTNTFTTASLIRRLAKLSEKNNTIEEFADGKMKKVYDETLRNPTHAIWICEEVGEFFDRLKHDKNIMSAENLLSILYDCRDYSKDTIIRGGEKIIAPYIPMYLASTDFLVESLTKKMLRQGLLNRFVYGDDKDPTREEKPLREEDLSFAENMEGVAIRRWCQVLYDRKKPMHHVYDNNAKERLDQLEEEISQKLSEIDELQKPYFKNQTELIRKIATVRQVDKMTIEKMRYTSKNTRTLFYIDLESVEYAIKIFNESFDVFNNMVVEIYDTTDKRNIEKVFDELKKLCGENNDWKDHSLVLHKSRMLTKNFVDIITTLKESLRIEEQKIVVKGRRVKIEYRILKNQ